MIVTIETCEFATPRSRGNTDVMLTESGNAGSKQLPVVSTEQLTE